VRWAIGRDGHDVRHPPSPTMAVGPDFAVHNGRLGRPARHLDAIKTRITLVGGCVTARTNGRPSTPQRATVPSMTRAPNGTCRWSPAGLTCDGNRTRATSVGWDGVGAAGPRHAARELVHIRDPGLAPAWRHARREAARVSVEPC
jgi:hypothetical protein